MATITTTKYSTLNKTIPMSPTSTSQQKAAQRKKKAARACVHCQKVFFFEIYAKKKLKYNILNQVILFQHRHI